MISLSMVMHFLGGLGLFLYGVNTTSMGLQKIAANKLKSILESLTRRTWVATLFGIAMTVALQSSAATTVMVVEFVNAGLMSLVQALGVALGSTVGTSIVIQLISLPILDIALFLLFIGFILLLIVKTQLTRQIGQTLIGFGCIFVGMSYLSGAFAPLKNSTEVFTFLSQFGANPIMGVLVSMLFTALLQSSSAFLAILISLSSQGLLSIESIIPLVLGAQIGGTITTLFSSLTAERIDAKRLAVANSIYRITATILLLPASPLFAKLVVWSAAELPRQVANTHLFSAIFMVIVFLPLNGFLAKLLVKMLPQRKRKIQRLAVKYITKSALEVPTVALSQAYQEIRWLGYKILDNMLQIIPRAFSSGEPRWVLEMEKAGQEVSWHYAQLSSFLKELFRRNMTRQQIVEDHVCQVMAKELDYIADSLIVMARLAQKIHINKTEIAAGDWARLEELYIAVSDNYLALLRYLDKRNPEVVAQVITVHENIIAIYNSLQGNMVCMINNTEAADLQTQLSEEERDWKNNLSTGQKAVLELGNWLYKIEEHIISIAKIGA